MASGYLIKRGSCRPFTKSCSNPSFSCAVLKKKNRKHAPQAGQPGLCVRSPEQTLTRTNAITLNLEFIYNRGKIVFKYALFYLEQHDGRSEESNVVRMSLVIFVHFHLRECGVNEIKIGTLNPDNTEGQDTSNGWWMELTRLKEKSFGRLNSLYLVGQDTHSYQDIRLQPVLVRQPMKATVVYAVAFLETVTREICQS